MKRKFSKEDIERFIKIIRDPNAKIETSPDLVINTIVKTNGSQKACDPIEQSVSILLAYHNLHNQN